MRLFISYARVDKPFCVQIVDTLDVHEVWYDQRLYAGQHWWKEILHRLDWCEGFIYLLSPDSVQSEYCQREYELARTLNRHIFPVLIHGDVTLPSNLAEFQYVDFSVGLTPQGIKTLLNSLYIAERQGNVEAATSATVISSSLLNTSGTDPAVVISSAAGAMENGEFDQAVFLLKRAKSEHLISQFIDIEALLQEAEAGLARQVYMREAEREYRQIAELVKFRRTRRLGCEAFQAFRKSFPDYDPENLGQTCCEKPASLPALVTKLTSKSITPLPMLEWCDVPAGSTLIQGVANNEPYEDQVYINGFQIAMYPVTNAQYEIFLQDEQGYANADWWRFSAEAYAWRIANPHPREGQFKGVDRPREMVTWYEAMAFCAWLSARLDQQVMLPTDHQWQRAARGDDRRVYPWGDVFDVARCNTSESKIKMTTLVMRYPGSISPFGVYDMAGNVWEWCISPESDPGNGNDLTTYCERTVHGGSFIGPAQRAKISFRYHLKPEFCYSSIGFRVVQVG